MVDGEQIATNLMEVFTQDSLGPFSGFVRSVGPAELSRCTGRSEVW